MAAPMASPSMMKNPYLSHLTFLGSFELIARRTNLASPLPSFHAALPATGATLAPAFAPALAALLLLRAIHYLHLRGVGLSKQRDTPKGPFGNSAEASGYRLQASGFSCALGELFVPAQFGYEGKHPVAHPPLVQRLLELGLAGERDLSCGRCLDEGGQVFSLRRREACAVEVVFPFEEPDPPRERDEDAAWLGTGDLTLSPVYVERRILVHVPEGPLEANCVIAAGEGRALHPLIREPLNPLVDPTLPRRVLPEAREIEPPLPVEVPMDDAGRIEVVHRGQQPVRISDPELPATS